MVINCDWVFLNQDGTMVGTALSESALPEIGDRKTFSGEGYEVLFTANKLVSSSNPIILAVEHK
jgi:hypothetical protein